MTSTGFEPSWQWPQDLPGGWTDENENDIHTQTHTTEHDTAHNRHGHSHNEGATKPTDPVKPTDSAPYTSSNTEDDNTRQRTQNGTRQEQQQQQHRRKFYGPRTCRICFETVLPTFHPPSETLPGVFQSSPSVTYESPEDGRLIRPCLCKGSQKYVHEGCLTLWRLQNPMEKRNYWQCPTCNYKYRLERMAWGRWISSTAAQIALTLGIFFAATFILGYVADPILNLYLDPYGTIVDIPDHGVHAIYEEEPDTWLEHFLKGMASLGILGFAKFLLTLSPFQWFNMRGTGVMGGGGARPGANGRERLQQISWIAVMVGIVTILVALWKAVRAWSRKTLENWSERVIDVPGGDDDDEDD